jgi:hypothetical protein
MHSLYKRVAGQSVERIAALIRVNPRKSVANNTYWAIAAIVLIQINYAIAPRFCWGLFSRNRNPEKTRLRIVNLPRKVYPCESA